MRTRMGRRFLLAIAAAALPSCNLFEPLTCLESVDCPDGTFCAT